MKIATWNVNSVRSRLERLLAWLQKAQPDIVCLQELKATDEAFPLRGDPAGGLPCGGLRPADVQRRGDPEPDRARRTSERGMDDGAEDPQARFLLAQVGGIQVISAYVPNGQVVGSRTLRLQARLVAAAAGLPGEELHAPDAPGGLRRLQRGPRRDGRGRSGGLGRAVLYHPTSRAALEELLSWGLVDVFRQQHPEGGLYSWWDYRMLAFPKNDGLRLDYIFATEPLADRCTAAEIDRQERKGEKPSDHAPVLAIFTEPDAHGQ